MLRNTAQNILAKALKSWLDSITDIGLRCELQTNVYIAGGAILSVYRGETPRDLDIYFSNKELAIRTLKYYGVIANNQYFIDLLGIPEDRLKIVSHNGELENDLEYTPVYATPNTLTLNNGIQLVIRYTGHPNFVLSKFDFDHTKMYYHCGELTIYDQALRSAFANELIYNRQAYPLSSLFRLKKFIRRGWGVSAGQLTKLAMQLALIDFSNLTLLKDQLYGIDVLYIESLVEQMEIYSVNNALSPDYISSLIDEVFNV